MNRILVVLLFLLNVQTFAQNFDNKIVLKWNQNRNVANDQFFLNLSQSADYVAIATPITLLAAGFIKNNSSLKKSSLQSGIALLGTYGVGYILKKTIKRERPFIALEGVSQVEAKDGYSMPSGSTAVVFSSAAALTSALPKWYVAIPAFGYASAVGFARVRSGEHYPSDVLAGAVLGAGSVWVSGKLMKWINRK
jgi:membrane-associated phospholipid phosphatase